MDPQRTRKLLDAYLDQAITLEELAELEQTLLASSAAREMFWDHSGFHALLRQFEAESCGPRMTEAVSEARKESRLLRFDFLQRKVLRWSAIAALFLAAAFWGGWGILGVLGGRAGFWAVDTQRPMEASSSLASGVAVLSATADLQWSDPGDSRSPGASLDPGWIRIKSGLAQIEFLSGARVILKGPAEFELISPMEAYCASGRLSADVPSPAHGFKIRTPEAEVVDLGTLFGLDVESGRGSKLEVFRGEVALHQNGENRRVVEGTAIEIAVNGVSRELASSPAGYPTSADLSEQSILANQRRRDAWQAAMLDLQKAPGLLLQYSFDPSSASDRTLVNRARATGRDGDGSIVGAHWGDGRWVGKSGLEFRGNNDRVRINIPGPLDSLTLMASVRVDSVTHSYNAILMGDSWVAGSIHWQIDRSGCVILGIHAPTNVGGYDYRTPVVFTPKRLGQWIQLAVVFDRGARRVTHYLDGQPVASEAFTSDVALRIGGAELGNWNKALQDPRFNRCFTGSMDGFALFNRALSPGELQRFSAL